MPDSSLENFEAPRENMYTDPLLFVQGEYDFSQVGRIPYFSTVMSLRALVDEIKLVEDIPGNTDFDWSLEELFQRDINWKRVKKELVDGYLKDSNKLCFFNSLTIALLPQDNGVITESYGLPISSPPVLYPNWECDDVGNIHIEYGPNKSIGVVQWHKERIFAVVIDGQHRLAALKEYWKELIDNSSATTQDIQLKIPILLLILDERVGFKGRNKKAPIKTLREIFIDLNKHARPVPKSRLILLEDMNAQSVGVRTLLKNDVTESTDKLPLSIVTWREDDAKFDSEYSITTVLNLNEIVSYCWDGLSLQGLDNLDERRVKDYVREIIGSLHLERKITDSINQRKELCIGRGEPFSFTEDQLTAIQKAFRQQWTPHIARIFREFRPYKLYFSKARDIGAINGILRDYLLLPKDQREKFCKRKKMENQTFNPRVTIEFPLAELEALKKGEWAFYVVFQKALFRNFLLLEPIRESLSIGEHGKDRNSFLTWWLEQVNALHESGVFNLNWKRGKDELWRGIAKNPISGTIQFSNAAVNRISSFITICIWFNLEPEQSETKTFVSLLKEDGARKLPNTVKRAFKRYVAGGLESLIRAKLDDDIEDEKLENMVRRELIKRLEASRG